MDPPEVWRSSRAAADSPDFQHLRQPAADPSLWPLDPKITFLNHGSFGSCPRVVLDFQREIRDRLERHPVQFLARDLESLLDDARFELARFMGAEARDLVFVQNATAGVNTVLRSLEFESGDELLVTDQEYNACRNALEFVAARARARVVVCPLPFPLQSPDEVVAAVLAKVTPRTRLALIDHVTSQTGLVLPIERLATALRERGVELLVDGAHAPGMVSLDLPRLGAAYYTGNCHKWVCAPKSAAFLHVRRDRQSAIRPLVISHGANSPRRDRSRFQIEFAWVGTTDPTAILSVPAALRFMQSVLPGGWEEARSRNRGLALAARQVLCSALAVAPPAPGEMIGSLASIPLPDGVSEAPPAGPLYLDPLQDRLRLEHGIEVPVIPWPAPPRRLLRVSAQLYNSLPQYEFLAQALLRELQP
jgi:isopenicillin-N epimerase